MKLPNLFKSRKRKLREKREQELIKDFEEGRIIHVNDGVNNKEIFSKKIL
jgi:hypothetical protein